MSHGTPEGECVFCCDELTSSTYVEYQAVEDGPWLPSLYCQSCIETNFIGRQWQTYLDNIHKADCAAALRRVLSQPPPINVKDAGLPCEANMETGEVYQFWYASTNQVASAKLTNSLVGAERDTFWAQQKELLAALEAAEAASGDMAKALAADGGGGAAAVIAPKSDSA